jgi:hypothetical protein
MIVSDSSRLTVSDSSDSDSPRSEPLPKRRLRKSTAEAQLEEPQPKHSLRNLLTRRRASVSYVKKCHSRERVLKTCKDDDKVADLKG